MYKSEWEKNSALFLLLSPLFFYSLMMSHFYSSFLIPAVGTCSTNNGKLFAGVYFFNRDAWQATPSRHILFRFCYRTCFFSELSSRQSSPDYLPIFDVDCRFPSIGQYQPRTNILSNGAECHSWNTWEMNPSEFSLGPNGCVHPSLEGY